MGNFIIVLRVAVGAARLCLKHPIWYRPSVHTQSPQKSLFCPVSLLVQGGGEGARKQSAASDEMWRERIVCRL